MMSKFKIGDTIKRVSNGASWAPIGYVTTVTEDSFGKPTYTDINGDTEVAIYAPDWELVTGPVRTVTRKEIVEGQYGMVLVDVHKDQVVVVVKPWHQPSPAELRAAAEVFTQLADALEDQK